MVFVNSVLGARSNRYGDFLDISCAVTGRAPAAGLHLDQGRRADLVLDISVGPMAGEDWFYPVLGCVPGETSGSRVPALVGLHAPGNLGVGVIFASTAECVEAAVNA